MSDMPRPRPPHLHKQITRHGVTVWYVRIGKGKRTRIKGVYGSEEFKCEYDAAIAGSPVSGRSKVKTGSLQWLWDKYRESLAWKGLSMATRRQRENIMREVLERSGEVEFADITKKIIAEGRDRRSEKPSMARHFVGTMRGMFAWALEADYVKEDPTAGVTTKKQKTEGFHVWTSDELLLFMEKWPLGTRERLAFDIIFYTGLRRGDAVKLGRQHVKNGMISFRTSKTTMPVKFPVLPPLQRSIEAVPSNDLTFFVSKHGRPMTKESFGNWFGSVCRDTGVNGTAHGLRKALATILSENGATNKELDSVFAWDDPKTSAIYTKTADRGRLASALFNRINVEQILNSLFPHPVEGEGVRPKK
jgi:integrase